MHRRSVVEEVFARHCRIRTGVAEDGAAPAAGKRAASRSAEGAPEPKAAASEQVEADRPCDVLQGDEAAPPPFRNYITQAQAYDLWKNHSIKNMGEGLSGAARLCRDEVSGAEMIVKQHSLTSPYAEKMERYLAEAKRFLARDPNNDGLARRVKEYELLAPRGQAANEVAMQRLIYSRMDAECRSFLSIPACMSFEPRFYEPDTGTERLFTVQTPVKTSVEGAELFDFEDWYREMLNVRPDYKKDSGQQAWVDFVSRVAAEYGRMLGCIHKHGIHHDDLHLGNTLVFWKGSSGPPYVLGDCSVELRAIDWGRAADHRDDMMRSRSGKPRTCGDYPRRGSQPHDWRAPSGFMLKGTPPCLAEKHYPLELLQELVVDRLFTRDVWDEFQAIFDEDQAAQDAHVEGTTDRDRIDTLMDSYQAAYWAELQRD